MTLGDRDKQSGAGGAGTNSSGGGGAFLGFHGAPTAANSADNNTCRLIDYRNAQVAAFHVSHLTAALTPASATVS